MTVQALIETLLQVKNKQQMVSVSVDDIEPTHTEIVGILSEQSTDQEIGICWLKIPKRSCLHAYCGDWDTQLGN